MEVFVRIFLSLFVIAAASVSLVSAGFVSLAMFHRYRDHTSDSAPTQPRTAIIIPAHNEEAVLGTTIQTLLSLEYPVDAVRIYVVDDASSDGTPALVQAAVAEHPGRIYYLRRNKGGEGKAAVLNHGLDVILADDWAEAVLIMDSDVLFTPTSLRRMTRHFADPEVGAVGAYIREGSRPGNSMTRFIGFEYVMAQALARRSSNLIGVAACLPGGAQLHTRANVEELGGRIDASTQAEDTVSTFQTQLNGRKVIFEGRAVALAEEPGDIDGLWKQRMRWARGNLQIVLKYRSVWFRPHTPLGRPTFGIVWFAVTLQPILMVLNAIALTILYFIHYGEAGALLRVFWISNALSWVTITVFGLLADRTTARHAWLQAVLFPGIISLGIIIYTVLPHVAIALINGVVHPLHWTLTPVAQHQEVLFAGIWSAACMVVAMAARGVERRLGLKRLALALVYLAGYGPLLCAIGFTAYIKELRGSEKRWEVTKKTGKMGDGANATTATSARPTEHTARPR
ncbi:MAG TPA: glycosyltransferase family 2 protein [Acidimicrobiales bacterium]|jgi:cellulose synthase/poly-beta-1,6-N-acetylglucosamine synthase-like glycosyltransferase|nr:glycosyltransferase family 2 protein [Acidimicrobiales bacterium]